MEFSPPRAQPLLLSTLLFALSAGAAGLGAFRLSQAELDLGLLLWFALAVLGFPAAGLAGYAVYGLATARYRIDREGFAARWGLAFEQAPLAHVQEVRGLDKISPAGDSSPRYRLIGWPGVHLDLPGVGAVEVFGSGPLEGSVLVDLKDKRILVTPADRSGFLDAWQNAVRQGSLTELEPQSYRPDFLVGRAWQDRAARALLAVGAAMPAGLLIYLSVLAAELPPQVPFGFDIQGLPGPLAPAGRLLLLPTMGVALWMVDAAVGLLLYRQSRSRPLAYALWATAVAASGLLWMAVISMLSTG